MAAARPRGVFSRCTYLGRVHATPFAQLCFLKRQSWAARGFANPEAANTNYESVHTTYSDPVSRFGAFCVSRTFCCRSIQRSPLLGVSQLVFLLLRMHGKLVIAVAAGQLQ